MRPVRAMLARRTYLGRESKVQASPRKAENITLLSSSWATHAIERHFPGGKPYTVMDVSMTSSRLTVKFLILDR